MSQAMSNVALNADLHCHSTISDGVLSPAVLAARAHQQGVQLWSLTDHDAVDGLEEAGQAARQYGMAFLPGVEISVSWANKTVHVVGLGIQANYPSLQTGLAELRAARIARGRRIADRLIELGLPDIYEGALQLATNPGLLNRTHFGRYMVANGLCATMRDAFKRYLGDGKPGDVKVQWASLEEALSWILGAGGKAILAHPGRYTYDDTALHALFDVFKQLGGKGVEVITGSHTPDQYKTYAAVARQYGFEASRGSDFHAPSESQIDLGALPPLPADLLPVWHDML